MHGVTREITLNVQLLSNDDSRWRVTTPPLRRSQFGLVFSKSAEMVSGIADEVAVDIEPRRLPRASDHTFLWAEFDAP